MKKSDYSRYKTLLNGIKKDIKEAILQVNGGPFDFEDDEELSESVAEDYAHSILRKLQIRQKPQKQTRQQIVLKGKKIVVTGTITGMTRKQITQKIKELGGTIQSGVTKETDVVITAKKAGKSKIEKAKKYGIKIVPFKQVSHRFNK